MAGHVLTVVAGMTEGAAAHVAKVFGAGEGHKKSGTIEINVAATTLVQVEQPKSNDELEMCSAPAAGTSAPSCLPLGCH